MKSKKKDLILSGLAVTLAVTVLIGGRTYATLYETTDDIVNNFQTNQVSVELIETTGSDYDIIPGTTQDKNPTVTVTNTVDAYVFVKIIDTKDGLVTYEIADGWLPLDGYENKYGGVYYREVAANDTEKDFEVIKDSLVSYSSLLTDEDMSNENGNLKDGVTLSFQASAVQKAGFENVEEAYLSKPIMVNVNTATDFADALQSDTINTIVIKNDMNLMNSEISRSQLIMKRNKTIILEGDFINAVNSFNGSKYITVNKGATLTVICDYDLAQSSLGKATFIFTVYGALIIKTPNYSYQTDRNDMDLGIVRYYEKK